MKEISVFGSKKEALDALDNGGRFFSFFAKANDGRIDKGELAKMAGTYGQQQRMILFLDLSLSALSDDERNHVFDSFSEDLQKKYDKYKSRLLDLCDLDEDDNLGSNIIVDAFPKALRVHSDFQGFIKTPVVSNKVTTTVLMPLIEQYKVYELYGEESGCEFIAAHHGQSEMLPGHRIRIGGVIKEMKLGNSEDSPSQKFLEAHYYTELSR